MSRTSGPPAHGAEEFIALQRELAGRYSLERELGRGGMGIVYLAREVRLDRMVALKVLPPELASRTEVRERFLEEARTAAKLSHPNIVPIYHVDEAGPFVFFAMSYIEGETLGERVRTHGPLGVPAATRILREIAWALAYAHLRGFVHGDVKPDNVMIERHTGRALLTDFGLARLQRTTSIDASGQVMATPHFASPEQVGGEDLDGRSDLYSLGIVGYYALSGRLPFIGSLTDVVNAHFRSAPPPLADHAPGTPTRLVQAIEKCLAKERSDRFQSAEQLAETIEQAVEQPRDIPAPIRVWLQQGDKSAPAWVVGSYVTLMMTGVVASEPALWWTLPIPALAMTTLVMLGRTLQTRKVLARGYDIDDLRVSLQRFVERRREELQFEHGGGNYKPALIGGAALTALGVAGAVFLRLSGIPDSAVPVVLTVTAGVSGVAVLVVAGIARPLRDLYLRHFGALRRKFWLSEWGNRIAKIARIGLKPVRAPEHIVHQPTEMAIGRATELLYQALPKPIRKQFRELPAVLRRLEKDAQAMRAEVDQLTTRLADIERPYEHSTPSLESQRRRIAEDLRATRDRAAQRLTAAVGALETIRLDLLRLQMGSAPEITVTQSLTAAIEAARRIGDDVVAVTEAREELDRMLAGSTNDPPR